MTAPGTQAARKVDDSEAIDHLARVGLLAFGVVHLVMGWLSIQLAIGDREGKADSNGAIQQLAEQPFGKALVWAIGIGMVLLALWQLVETVVGHRNLSGGKRLRKRLISLGKAVVYAAIAQSALRVAVGSRSSSQGDSTDSTSAKLMDLPLGQLIIGAVALGIATVAGYLIRRGVLKTFLKDIDSDGTDGKVGTAYVWLGRIGYIAKGAAVLSVAALFGYAAATHEAKKSGGLDEALLTVLEQPFGPIVIGLVGAGFIAFGLFCFAWARHIDR
ncbi:MAG TPA: DUF1206 domain-containing protein [Nocardioides sp.]